MPPGDTWQCLELGSATGVLWVEARDAVKHPSMHRSALHNKELSPQMSIVLRLRKLVLWLHSKMKTKIKQLKESNLYDTIILF